MSPIQWLIIVWIVAIVCSLLSRLVFKRLGYLYVAWCLFVAIVFSLWWFSFYTSVFG